MNSWLKIPDVLVERAYFYTEYLLLVQLLFAELFMIC